VADKSLIVIYKIFFAFS